MLQTHYWHSDKFTQHCTQQKEGTTVLFKYFKDFAQNPHENMPFQTDSNSKIPNVHSTYCAYRKNRNASMFHDCKLSLTISPIITIAKIYKPRQLN